MMDNFNNLPILAGTEKQIRWAEDIRRKFIENNSIDGIDAIILNEQSSAFWIDNRRYLDEEFIKIYKNIIKPAEVLHNGVVEIIECSERSRYSSKEQKKIRVHYKFALGYPVELEKIMEKLGYIEDYDEWSKNINEMTGGFADRAAEIGALLLEKGFTISISDKTAREKAITKDYEEEYPRWVDANKSHFVVRWQEDDTKNDEFVDTLEKMGGEIRKSKTNRALVYINFEKNEELLAFVKANGFKLTKKAKEGILCQE